MDDALLIEQVKKFTFLYDKNHKEFKDKMSRENAWRTIASILETSDQDVESSWINLRNRYNAEKRRIRCIPTGSGAYKERRLFKLLTFLDPFIATRKTLSNVKIPKEGPPIEENLWETQVLTPIDNLMENSEIDNTMDTGTATSNDQFEMNTPRAGSSMQGEHRKRINVESMKRKSKANALEECIVGAFSKLETMITTEPDSETENSLFGRMIGQSLNRLSSKKKQARVKKDILEISENYESDD